MSNYPNRLPQLNSTLFLTDGWLETTLIYHGGVNLPHFAAFDLLKDETGTAILRRYYTRYTELACAHGVGIVLKSATWRSNPDWAAKLGYDAVTLADANRQSIGLLLEIRAALETCATPVVIRGCLGPRGDGYRPATRMSIGAALPRGPDRDLRSDRCRQGRGLHAELYG